MDKKLILPFHEACYTAKKIIEMIPSSVDGLTPHYLHVIGAVHALCLKQEKVRVSDVAVRLNLSKRTSAEYIHSLSEKGLVQKFSEENGRSVYVTLTEKGESYYSETVEKYHERLSRIFDGVNNNDMMTTIRTIQQSYYLIHQERERTQKKA